MGTKLADTGKAYATDYEILTIDSIGDAIVYAHNTKKMEQFLLCAIVRELSELNHAVQKLLNLTTEQAAPSVASTPKAPSVADLLKDTDWYSVKFVSQKQIREVVECYQTIEAALDSPMSEIHAGIGWAREQKIKDMLRRVRKRLAAIPAK